MALDGLVFFGTFARFAANDVVEASAEFAQKSASDGEDEDQPQKADHGHVEEVEELGTVVTTAVIIDLAEQIVGESPIRTHNCEKNVNFFSKSFLENCIA